MHTPGGGGARQSRRLLVLGGTQFLGREIVCAALRGGWQVTTFNRGRSGRDVAGVQVRRGDRYRPDDVERLAAAGPWDVVVDASGYVPANTLAVVRALEPVAERYVFISTVSVYEGWPAMPLTEESPVLPSPPDAGPDYGTDTEDGPTKYGYQKAGCEAAALKIFGGGRTAILRPGVVLGPREYVGRLPWWLTRIAAGGSVLAPGDPNRGIQPIDVRDVADFAVRIAATNIEGTFNATAPIGHATFEELLRSCQTATGSDARFVWASDELLIRERVRQWSEMPLWRTSSGVWRVDSTKAQNSGLTARSIAATVADTWAWLQNDGFRGDDERANEIGISAAKEARILQAVLNAR